MRRRHTTMGPIMGAMYDLGVNTNFDLKTKFPNHYQLLTAELFLAKAQDCTRTQSQSPTGGRDPSFSSIEISYVAPTYNSSTGALSYYTKSWGRPGSSDGASTSYVGVNVAVFVPGLDDPSISGYMFPVHNYAQIGYKSSSFNVKSDCKFYKKLTTDNFFITDFAMASSSVTGSSHTNSITLKKLYNANTGDATCNIYASYTATDLSTNVIIIW